MWRWLLLNALFAGALLLLARPGEGESWLWIALPLLAVAHGAALWWLWSGGLSDLREAARRMAIGEGGRVPALPEHAPRPARELAAALDELGEYLQRQLAQVEVQRARLEALLDSIAAGILVTDRDGRVVLANRALGALFGEHASLQGRHYVEMVRSTAVQEAVELALARGQEAAREIVLPGGVERHLEVQVAPIRSQGECTGVVAVFYDITRLRRLEHMHKDFVANVSHELRTPLTAIKGCAETLADGAIDDRQVAGRFVQVINSHANRLAQLLDDLLSLARLESERLEVQREPCRLRQLAESCASAVGKLASDKRIAIAVEIPDELSAWCDRKLIEQALINLLDNAVKYTSEGGGVRVRARVSEQEAEQRNGASRMEVALPGPPDPRNRIAVEVTDTGNGIPSAELGRVFERFYRVDKGRSRALGGSGLGLSIVRHVIEAHNERLWVESELGKGSTFGFTLPVVS